MVFLMHWLSRALLCTLVVIGTGCASHGTTPAAPSGLTTTQAKATATTPLLLISIDAFRADYLDRGRSPTLQALAATGVRTSMQPSFPSLTFPNHYTMVTGLVPDHHGIVANTMVDPNLGKFTHDDRKAVGNEFWWDQATPIWVTADAHGIRTATLFWPGSEAPVQGRHPDYWKPFDKKVTADQRVDQVLAWLDLPADQRPGFITLYFNAVDTAGHEHGPDSPQLNQAIQDTDEAMARLVDGLRQRGLYDRMNIIVVADHGMANAPAGNTILIDKLISMKDVDTVTLGVVAGFNPVRKHDFNAVEQQLEQPQEHMHCWDKTRIPKRFNYGSNARVPQMICLADVGWRISTTEQVGKQKGEPHVGEHGYDIADPTMQAVFVAHGPAFQNGVRYHDFPNVDVYPLMTQLLGIPARFNDGSFKDVQDMLKPSALPAQ